MINDISELNSLLDLNTDTLAEKPITTLLKQENDAQNNMFEVFLVIKKAKSNNNISWKDFYTSQDDNISGKKFIKLLSGSENLSSDTFGESASSFQFRCKSINFPQTQADVQNQVLFGNVITRMTGSIKTKRSGSFTLSLDTNMFISDGLNLLSKYYGSLHETEKNSFIENYKKITNIEPNKNYLNNYIFPCFFRRSYNLYDPSTYFCADLVVKYLTQYKNERETNLNNLKYDRDLLSVDKFLDNSIQYFVLHDIRFLGRSSALEFKNDDGGDMSVTFNFIYKDATSFRKN